MAPQQRTPHQRDRRFARVRHLTQTIFIGAGVVSGLFVAYASSTAKPVATVTVPPVTKTTTPSSSSDSTTDETSQTTTTTLYTPPTSVATTTTTTCTTTPSGQTTCN